MSVSTKMLVKQAQNGNAEAFGELYETYADELYRYALWYLGSKEAAEDAVQETICNAYIKISALKKAESFKPWIFKILVNCCKHILREKITQRNTTLPQDEAEETSADFIGDEELALREAVLQLEVEEKEILLLSAIYGYNSSEIGKMLSLPSGTVRSKLSRTAEKLRKKLTDTNAHFPL